jgi:hypothetical protein
MESILATMLSEFVKALGADKVKEISDGVCKPVKKTEPVKEEKPPKAEAKAAEAKKTVKKEQADGGAAAAGEKTKRIARMSPTLTNQLKAELIKIGIVFIDDDKKQVEFLKKEFTRYIDTMSEGDFSAKDLARHMRDFANTKKPAPEEKEEVPPKKVAIPTLSNAAAITDVDIDELRAIKMVAKPGVLPDGRKWNGEFWDGDEGRFVRGPPREDGDGNHVKFNGKDYYYEAGSFRVYEEVDGKDVFVGYVGVGQFRDMKI